MTNTKQNNTPPFFLLSVSRYHYRTAFSFSNRS